MAKKTSTRGRMVGIVGAVVIALGAVAVVFFLDSGSHGPSKTFTPVNRDMQTAARDVLKAVKEWYDANGGAAEPAEDAPAPEGAGMAPAAAVVPPGEGPVDLTIVLRDRDVSELPDDLTVVVCPDLKAWFDVQTATAFAPLIVAKSPTALGSDVVVYDGKGIVQVAASAAPGWAAGGAGGGFVWTKKDLAGSEKSITLKR